MTRLLLALALVGLTAACGVDGDPIPAPGPATLSIGGRAN